MEVNFIIYKIFRILVFLSNTLFSKDMLVPNLITQLNSGLKFSMKDFSHKEILHCKRDLSIKVSKNMSPKWKENHIAFVSYNKIKEVRCQ